MPEAKGEGEGTTAAKKAMIRNIRYISTMRPRRSSTPSATPCRSNGQRKGQRFSTSTSKVNGDGTTNLSCEQLQVWNSVSWNHVWSQEGQNSSGGGWMQMGATLEGTRAKRDAAAKRPPARSLCSRTSPLRFIRLSKISSTKQADPITDEANIDRNCGIPRAHEDAQIKDPRSMGARSDDRDGGCNANECPCGASVGFTVKRPRMRSQGTKSKKPVSLKTGSCLHLQQEKRYPTW